MAHAGDDAEPRARDRFGQPPRGRLREDGIGLAVHDRHGEPQRDIARRAGVSQAAPYHHFADKEALVAAVAGECARLLLAALEAAVTEAGDDQRRRFQLTGIAYIRFAVAHPAHFRAMELPGIADQMPRDVRLRFDAFYAEEERRMRAAQAEGLFAPLPFDRMILAATALVHGLAHLVINGATEAKPTDVDHALRLARDVTAVLGAGLLPRAAPPRAG